MTFDEDFILLTARRAESGLGGEDAVWADGPALRMGCVPRTASPREDAGAARAPLACTLWMPRGTGLVPGDRLRRARDGRVLRVTTPSSWRQAPDGAGLALEAADAEVIA